jgi:acetyl-CoA carboxylase carboxyltransferase component
VPILDSSHDPTSAAAHTNRAAMLSRLGQLDDVLRDNLGGGGERYVRRHHERGKLSVRERIELLIDRDAPFLELQPFVGWGSDYKVGGSLVTGIGPVAGVECVVIANDPTVRGGTSNPYTWRKALRAMEICEQNRLPLIQLVESGGADLTTQAEGFIPGGATFRNITRLSALGIPTLAIVFGNSTAGGAYLPGMSDYTVFVRGNAKVFLGGPPLVKMATGEEADEEELGGAEMHAGLSGLADYLAEDEPDALRLGREILGRANWRKRGWGPTAIPDPPAHDPQELLGVIPADLKVPFDPREVIARVVDGSRYDEFKQRYGTSLTTGWASIHGYEIGVLANVQGVLFSEEAQKAAQFIQLANQKEVPLLFLHNTTGYMVGRRYEQGGIVKHGSLMINAVANSKVPHLVVILGSSYGAGNYGMSGRAFGPRLLFAWPSAQSAVMGPQQLAGVLSIVARAAAERRGDEYSEEEDGEMRARIEAQIEAEQVALANSARGYDDGVIDPRDTRTALGIALSAIDSGEVVGARGYGVFRM